MQSIFLLAFILISNPSDFIMKVSFFSSSPELSNKQRFEYFSRTIPSDNHQVKAMVEIICRLGWTYISILYEESTYGIKVSWLSLFHCTNQFPVKVLPWNDKKIYLKDFFNDISKPFGLLY